MASACKMWETYQLSYNWNGSSQISLGIFNENLWGRLLDVTFMYWLKIMSVGLYISMWGYIYIYIFSRYGTIKDAGHICRWVTGYWVLSRITFPQGCSRERREIEAISVLYVYLVRTHTFLQIYMWRFAPNGRPREIHPLGFCSHICHSLVPVLEGKQNLISYYSRQIWIIFLEFYTSPEQILRSF